MNLRQALMGIRKAFGNEELTNRFLSVTESVIQMNRNEIWLDTGVFDEHLQATVNHIHGSDNTCLECVSHLEQAIQLYHGNFLADLMLGDVAEFQEWLVLEREHYFNRMLNAIKSLARIYYNRSEYDQAYLYIKRHIDLAPLEESAHRLLMRIFYLTGRRNAALEQYHEFAEITQRELDIEPTSATKQLYEYIKCEFPIEKKDTGQLVSPADGQITRAPIQPTSSLYDPATQVPLHALFMDRLQHAITRMERYQLGIGVLVLSVTYQYNQELKPDQMRQVKQHLINRLLHSVRKGDTVASLQENVYGIILEEIRDSEVVPQIVEKIRFAISAPIRVFGTSIRVEMVHGYSLYPNDSSDPTILLAQADRTMNSARLESHLSSPSSLP
jgi:DNA-binding SARP family transcriptional activator